MRNSLNTQSFFITGLSTAEQVASSVIMQQNAIHPTARLLLIEILSIINILKTVTN
jgi:hypothetical protein